MNSSAAWAILDEVREVTRVGYHPKPPKDRTESSIRWSLLFFLGTALALWAFGL